VPAQLVLAQVAQARHHFRRAIEIATATLEHGSSPGGLTVLTTSELALGDLSSASLHSDALAKMHPGLSSYGLRALVLIAQGRDEEALFDFRRALAVQDLGAGQDAVWERCMLARYWLRHGQPAAADEQIERALAARPGFHLALDLKGEMESAKGDWDAAERDFRDAFRATKQVAYLVHWGIAKRKQGQAQAGDELLREAERSIRSEIETGGFGHRLELAKLLLERGGTGAVGEAVHLARQEASERRNWETLVTLARALLYSGDARGAEETINGVLRTGIRDFEVYLWAGRIQEQLGNATRAAFFLRRAVEVNPLATRDPVRKAVRSEAQAAAHLPHQRLTRLWSPSRP
jgi:tetratricopeptide (TPR) repeat protein